MIGTFVGLVVIPLVIAGLARWAAARRRRGLAAGRPVHFRGRLDGRKGRLLVDPRLDGPVFLDRAGTVTALPRGGVALDATVMTSATGEPGFEKVALRYRTPDGVVVRLGLATQDARTVGEWLAQARDTQPADTQAPAPGDGARRLPVAPLWAVLALGGAVVVGLLSADVALLGRQMSAPVVQVNGTGDGCVVRWDGGLRRATVDCDEATTHVGDRVAITALPWPLLGEAVEDRTTAVVAAAVGGGLGLLGLTGALLLTPPACARRVRRVLAAGPALAPQRAGSAGDAEEGAEEGEEEWPSLATDPSFANLAFAARHNDRHRSGPGVSAPRRARRGPGTASASTFRWVTGTVLGTGAWWFLLMSVDSIWDDHLHLGRLRYVVMGALGIASLARIGWVLANRSAVCGPVLRAARGQVPADEWQPRRYVRLRRGPGEMALVLFRADGDESVPPLHLQPISWSLGSGRRTTGGPAPVGEALVFDTGVGPLLCEIDGVRYLPKGDAHAFAADSANPADAAGARSELRSFAESHRRSLTRR